MKSLFTPMLIIFYAIMTGHVLFALVAVFVLNAGAGEVNGGYEVFTYVAASISVMAVGAAYLIYKNKLETILKLRDDTSKLMEWRSTLIIKLAILEMPCLLNLVFLILTNNRIFLYIYVVVAIIMLLNKPVKYKVYEELNLESENF